MPLKLTQLASKPQLIKITIDDEKIVERHGDSLEFWIYDRQPIDQFVRIATAGTDNYGELIALINDLVLDEQGNRVITAEQVLPSDVMVAVIGAVVERLGK